MTACGACAPSSTCARISTWGRQLASIRAEISNTLQSEIDSVPGRVRRILRQRSDKDILAGARIDNSEVDDAAALIDFVAVCRTYASELAINEVTLRTYSDLQQYVEKATEALVQSLRAGDLRARAYRQMQAEAAVRFCEALFGARIRVPDEQVGRERACRRTQVFPQRLADVFPSLQFMVDEDGADTYGLAQNSRLPISPRIRQFPANEFSH